VLDGHLWGQEHCGGSGESSGAWQWSANVTSTRCSSVHNLTEHSASKLHNAESMLTVSRSECSRHADC
jgi:hypothetical protein